MEDNLNFCEMEDDLNFLEMEDDLKCLEMEDNIRLFGNGRRPQFNVYESWRPGHLIFNKWNV